MKPPATALSDIRELEPACMKMVIPTAWRDGNGHMNMRWYVGIFDDAGDSLRVRLGLDPEHLPDSTGTFDLEHHTHFLNEVVPGDEITVYARMLDASPKRIHYAMFMINETRKQLAAIFECVNGLVDLRIRKIIPYPPPTAARINAALTADSRLAWEAPACGSMKS